jgi:hypothetical protein
MSTAVSVSAATSGSAVLKKSLEPSCEPATKVAVFAAFPPVGPVESSVVAPPERS